jgi:hypothetical protein
VDPAWLRSGSSSSPSSRAEVVDEINPACLIGTRTKADCILKLGLHGHRGWAIDSPPARTDRVGHEPDFERSRRAVKQAHCHPVDVEAVADQLAADLV